VDILKIVTIIVVSVLAMALVCNGIAMLYDPETWFWNVPGVPQAGLYNAQFVRDIGIVYIFAGASFVAGTRFDRRCAELWGVPTLWLVAHAISHASSAFYGACGSMDSLALFSIIVPPLAGLAASFAAIADRLKPPRRDLNSDFGYLDFGVPSRED
jgi:hypothetical protein